MKWEFKKEVLKGNIGEQIIKKYFEERNYVVYKPITKGSHKVDYIVHSWENKNIVAVECKTKKRMAKMNYTGFETRSFNEYKDLYLRYNIRTFIFFIDEFEEAVYGGFLDELGDEKYINDNKIVLFRLENMKKFFDIEKELVDELKEKTTGNYVYKNTKKFFSI